MKLLGDNLLSISKEKKKVEAKLKQKKTQTEAKKPLVKGGVKANGKLDMDYDDYADDVRLRLFLFVFPS